MKQRKKKWTTNSMITCEKDKLPQTIVTNTETGSTKVGKLLHQ